jgi:hypothetical protein
MTENARRGVAVLTLGYLAAGVGFSIVLDWFGEITIIPWFSVCGVLAVALFGSLGWWLSKKRVVGATTVVAILGLSALRFVELSPVKPFREFYRQLEPGMSESEVLHVLEREFSADGRYPRPRVNYTREPEPELAGFTLDPTDGRYSSEVISLTFDQGKLETAEYLPD